MLAGTSGAGEKSDTEAADGSQVTAGSWLAETFRALRAPNGADIDRGPALKGSLRPYQKAGVGDELACCVGCSSQTRSSGTDRRGRNRLPIPRRRQ
jgi:hypothetical protein